MQSTVSLHPTLEQMESAAEAGEAFSLPAPPELTDALETSQAHVMIADDEPLGLAVMHGYLERDGYRQVSTVDDGTKVLGMLRLNMPDALLLDAQMSQVNGLDLLSAVRADDRFAALPVIVLSTSPDSAT